MNQIITKPSLESLLERKEYKTLLNILAWKAGQLFHRYNTHVISRKDLIQEAITASCAAYKNFDPALGKWETFIYMYARNAMHTLCKKFCHPLSISEKDARENLPYIGSIGVMRIDNDRNDYENKFDIPVGSGVDISEIDFEEAYFKGLPAINVSILKEHIFEDRTMYYISQKYGMSKSRVFNIIHETMSRIKEKVEHEQEN